MKKIILLLAVSLMTGVSSAGYYLTINGQDVESAIVPIGQSVTVGIHSTDTSVVPEPTAWGAYGNYHELTLVSHKEPWYQGDTGIGSFTNPVINANAGASAGVSGGGSQMENSYWTQQNPTDLTAGLWFEWTFTSTGETGTILLTTWGENWAYTIGDWDTVAINPIPEPATMTILGLGVLALIRRK